MILRIFAAWIDGLANAVIWVENRFRHPRLFRLNAAFQPLTLRSLDTSTQKRSASSTTTQFDNLPQEVTRETRGGVIEIVVPGEAILERQLDPLPGESLPYVEQVVQHQLEQIFPWRATDILHSNFIGREADGRLHIKVRATARSAIEEALAAATACGVDEVLIITDTGNVAHDRANAIIASIGHGI